MSKIRKYLFLSLLLNVILFSLSISEAYSQTKKYTFEKDNITLEADIFYYLDESHLLEFEDISKASFSSKFIKSKSQRFNLGKTDANAWIKIVVENKNHLDIEDWVLELAYPTLDSIEFYYQNERGVFESRLTGDFFTFKERPIFDVNFIFPISLTNNSTQVFYLKATSQGALVFPIKISSKGQYIKNSQSHTIVFGVFYGVMLIMLMYNFIIYIASRDINYLLYAIALIGHLLFLSAKNGHSYQYIFGGSPYWGNLFFEIGMAVLLTGDVLFTKYFINSKKYIPKFDKILSLLLLLGGFMFILPFFVEYKTVMKVGTLLALLALVILPMSGIIVWIKGNTSARFFVFAWTAYAIGNVIYILNTMGVLPDTNFTFYAIEVGTILEILLLSLALVDKFRIIREKQIKNQAKIISIQEKANEELEQKVIRRTTDINNQKEELHTIAESLTKKNNNITASINYAKRIQDAMLPLVENIQANLPESFIFYQPRDIVSGDFYWFYQKDDEMIIAAVDCTGHGVPGAFMSLVANNLLHNIIVYQGIMEPDKILSKLHRATYAYLKQGQTRNQDGMDISLCHIDKKAGILSFAGAKNPLVYIQNGEIKVIKGTRSSIGGYSKFSDANVVFEKHTINLTENSSTFYIYTDGFQDQFGGEKGGKFRTAPFRELLAKISQEPTDKQENLLTKSFEDWKGAEKQIDDVLVIGFKV